MSYVALGIDVQGSLDVKAQATSTGVNVYSECHTKVKQQGQTKATFEGCLGTSAAAAAAIVCGSYASPELAGICSSVAGQVVGKLAGALYDLGDALGLTGDKEWAEKQASDLAAWNAWTTAFQVLLQARLQAQAKLDAAIVAAQKAEQVASLAPSSPAAVIAFFQAHNAPSEWSGSLNKFSPPDYDTPFCSASGGCYGTSAGNVVAYAWKTAANTAFKQYSAWFDALDSALQAWFASVTVRAVQQQILAKQAAGLIKIQNQSKLPTAQASVLTGFAVTGAIAAIGYWIYKRKYG